ncbi:hypothetical protein, partial [Porphyromonas endodontalis]|uniref:hypothetical protein n=1 Tax=Porphyromonas endodontalis TaxID=28124 RepID=UPI003C7E4780
TGRFFSGGAALTPATVINRHSSEIANLFILLFSVVYSVSGDEFGLYQIIGCKVTMLNAPIKYL